MAKFLEDADKEGTLAEAVKDFVLQLKQEAVVHNQDEECERCIELLKPGNTAHPNPTHLCIGMHVMRILKRATNIHDPIFEGMDMITVLQVKTGATSAMNMVK